MGKTVAVDYVRGYGGTSFHRPCGSLLGLSIPLVEMTNEEMARNGDMGFGRDLGGHGGCVDERARYSLAQVVRMVRHYWRRKPSYVSTILVAKGSWLGPYALTWELITRARGLLHFPIGWYPWPLFLSPSVWYSVMALGFTLLYLGSRG